MDVSEDLARELIGTAFPKYRLAEELGSGSFGAVFMVKSNHLDRAVKIVPLSARRGRSKESGSVTSAADRLSRDWRHLLERYERLRCPEVVAVHDFHLVEAAMGDKSAQAFGLVLLDLYPSNLEEWVFDAKQDIWRRVLVVQEVARILDVLNRERSFRFEDLKPENILIRDDPSGLKVVAGDIGGLKGIGSASRASTSVQMSLDYGAPEVIRKGHRPDTLSVIYSFGLLAFFVIEGGRLPYEEVEITDRFDHIRDRGPDFEEATGPAFAQVRTVVERCLAFAPEDRISDFASVVAALDGGSGDEDPALELGTDEARPPTNGIADGGTIALDDFSPALGFSDPVPSTVFRESTDPEQVEAVVSSDNSANADDTVAEDRGSHHFPSDLRNVADQTRHSQTAAGGGSKSKSISLAGASEHSGGKSRARRKEVIEKSDDKPGWSEEFQILYEYDPVVTRYHDELEDLDPQLSKRFRAEVVSNRNEALDILNRLKAEGEKKINPFASKKLNEALAEARLIGPRAEEEFARIVEVMGEEIAVDRILGRLKKKYLDFTAPDPSLSQADRDRRLFMALTSEPTPTDICYEVGSKWADDVRNGTLNRRAREHLIELYRKFCGPAS
jgi:serine/threonine protein kinase